MRAPRLDGQHSFVAGGHLTPVSSTCVQPATPVPDSANQTEDARSLIRPDRTFLNRNLTFDSSS
jgi:hypothetical protein